MLSWLPQDVSTFGPDIDSLFYLIYYLTTFTGLAVLVGLAYFLIKYRARKGGRAIYSHGNTTLEIIWTLIPALVFVMLGVMSKTLWGNIKESLPETDLRVRIQGSQFNWKMSYPGPDGVLDTADDYSQENLLRIPVNRPVIAVLSSKDVIHSFFLPNLRLKQDAVPGRDIQVWFEATKTGEYEIPCAELCGFGHSNMKGSLKVLTAEEFESWAHEKKAFP